MRRVFRYGRFAECLLALVLISSCSKKPQAAMTSGQMLFSDAIATMTKTDPLHVNHDATSFTTGTNIQLCIDYAHKDSPSSKQEYVSGVQFTKIPAGYFDSDYSIVWLNDYLFDVYAFYPHDVKLNIAADSDELDIDYYLIKSKYTEIPQYYEDSGGEWYVTSGATIYSNATETTPAADPHDLITSMVLNSETAPTPDDITFETKYSDHGEEPVNLKFMHRLSRLEMYFVNGMGASEVVKLKGIAIYPVIRKASFAAKRHFWKWNKTDSLDLFKYDETLTGWVHRAANAVSWPNISSAVITGDGWSPYYDDAPMKYKFDEPYQISSTDALMAKDVVTVGGTSRQPYVEFRMLPESEIDCLILKLKISGSDAYLPVQFNSAMNHDKAVKTQMGHTTRVVLAYKASMITLINVYYKNWDNLPGRYVVGGVKIE